MSIVCTESVVRVAPRQWSLSDALVDLWSQVEPRATYRRAKGLLQYPGKGAVAYKVFRRLLRGGIASPRAARQTARALLGTPIGSLPTTPIRLLTADIRAIRERAGGVRNSTLHRHLVTSVSHYSERGHGGQTVPVHRTIDAGRFSDAMNGDECRLSDVRIIRSWRNDLRPFVWPPLPVLDELTRAGECIGMGRRPRRGSWFGGLCEPVDRAMFWQRNRLRDYLTTMGASPRAAALLRATPMGSRSTTLMFGERLAIVAVIMANTPPVLGDEHYEGHLWSLNRLLCMDASRWTATNRTWQDHDATCRPEILDLLAKDRTLAREWCGSMAHYPAAYNCDPMYIWPVLVESAYFWSAFCDVLEGKGWGPSSAAQYVRSGT